MTIIDNASLDPFTRVYRAILDRLYQRPQVAARVKLRNRLDHTNGEGDQRKGNAATADFPELELLPTGNASLVYLSSSSVQAVQRYTLVVRTASMNAARELFPLQWALLCAFTEMDDHLGLPFVIKVEPSTDAYAIAEGGRRGNVRAWTSVGTVTVTMVFSRDELKEL